MSFVDKVKIKVFAGDGGNGKLSFRHEKYIDKGGPDGGDAGKGGDVVFQASLNQNTLAAFRYKKEIKADNGNPGDKRNMHGRNAKDLIIKVPVGTIVTSTDGRLIADLITNNQQAVIAKGGKGGFGNAHFVSSRRQAPNFAEKGEPGEEYEVELELKMIADVGLVGLPNAGKSTFLATVSNARPEIADYPFTTLTPNLGVVDVDENTTVLIADIPGLIEGAASGKGLGHDFLKHVERTAVILHLVDAYNEDVSASYKTIRDELKAYGQELDSRPEIVVLTKSEGLDAESLDSLKDDLRKIVPKKTSIMSISSQSGEGVKELLFALAKITTKTRKKQITYEAKELNAIPVLTIQDNSSAFTVSEQGERFIVNGQRIEQFAKRTDFNSEEGVQRLRDIMRRAGILHELRRRGILADQEIQIGTNEKQIINY